MQHDMPGPADNPFTIGHRAAARKAETEAATKAHEAMRDAATERGKATMVPKPIYRPYKPDFSPR